ncbi:hypothetical protein DdX_14934 [Ditylenchus destructor]|uniref:Uncharacterized protein n=1 Tax=Ditylenchus destructor TaxID=166010 RepID=A0AAD4MSE5_9BILA|nr:hypothetical protein DdX_14934 [Ditylenchus destructor]
MNGKDAISAAQTPNYKSIASSHSCKSPKSNVAVDSQTGKVRSLINGQELGSSIWDGLYVNVNNADAFLVTMQASITFICLIGALTAFNTLTFTAQISSTNLLCSINDFLPLGQELRKIVMPIVYYCRFLELSVSTNVLQLLFCLAALVCALNRRSNLFLLCYSFLFVTLFLGGAFLLTLIILNYERFIVEAVNGMLDWVLTHDNSFCQMLEPQLNCRITNATIPSKLVRAIRRNTNHTLASAADPTDLIELACGMTPRRYVSHMNGTIPGFRKPLQECTDYLTSFLIDRNWLIGLMLEYAFVVVAGSYITVHAILKRRRKIERSRRTNSINNGLSGQLLTHSHSMEDSSDRHRGHTQAGDIPTIVVRSPTVHSAQSNATNSDKTHDNSG